MFAAGKGRGHSLCPVYERSWVLGCKRMAAALAGMEIRAYVLDTQEEIPPGCGVRDAQDHEQDYERGCIECILEKFREMRALRPAT